MMKTRRWQVALAAMIFWSTLATAAPSAGRWSYFTEQCKEPKSDDIARTIKGLLEQMGTEDCDRARGSLSITRELSLKGKGLVDLSPLSEFSLLIVLDIGDNNVTDFSFLKGMTKLKQLYAERNGITDLSVMVQAAPQLTVVHVDGNQLTDISPLQRLVNLRSLSARNNQITSFDFRGQRKLNQLDLSFNQISSVEGIGEQIRLLSVVLRGNRIADIAPLVGNSSIWNLDIDDNQVANLEPITRLQNLKWLHAEGNAITDISPLADLTLLQGLYLGRNKISELVTLDSPNLSLLYLDSNAITDVSPLAAMPALEFIVLTDNAIESIAPLRELEAVTRFKMSGNPLGTSTAKSPDNCPPDAKSPAIAAFCAGP